MIKENLNSKQEDFLLEQSREEIADIEGTLSSKIFWVRDYDLDNLREQIAKGKDDCIIQVKNVREFIKKCESRIDDEFIYGYIGDCKLCKKEDTLVNSDSDCILCKIKQIIKEEAGEELAPGTGELANHNPQKLIMNTRRWAGKGQAQKMLKDNDKDLCVNCGKPESEHHYYYKACYTINEARDMRYKKFGPLKKGCGKFMFWHYGKKVNCGDFILGEIQLCHACSKKGCGGPLDPNNPDVGKCGDLEYPDKIKLCPACSGDEK